MKYIKHPIPEEITDKGGASVQLVQKQTIPLDGAIDAAIEAHYAIGQKEFIRNGVIGTMKSMAAGVRRDGRPRSIEGFLTVYPVFKGPIDLEKGYDPAVNKVQIKARLLNELELDISNWTFEDVTPGKKSFKLNTVKAGSVLGVVNVGEKIELNGDGLPSTKAGEELRVHWAVEGTDKSGDIPAAKMTSDVGRADIADDALAELASEEYDGKQIVFTVRGNFSSAKIAATLKYAPPPALWTSPDGLTKVTKLYDARGEECKLATDKVPVYMEGVGLDRLDTMFMFFGNTRAMGSYYASPEVVESGTKLQLSLDAAKSVPSGTYEGSLYLQLDGDESSGGLIPLTLEIKS